MTRWSVGVFLMVLMLLVGAGATFFILILQTHPDEIKPTLEAKISEALGMEVRIGQLGFDWAGGFGIKADEIELRNQRGNVPLLNAKSLFLRLHPFDLLRGKLKVSDFTLLTPQVHFVKTSERINNWDKVSESEDESAVRSKSVSWVENWAQGLVVFFSSLRVEEGSILYRDETRTPPLLLSLHDVRADIEQEFMGGLWRGRGEGRFLNAKELDLVWNTSWQTLEQEVEFEATLKEVGILKAIALPFQNPPRFKGLLKLEDLDLRQLPLDLSGRVSGDVELEGSGQNELEIKKSLQGRGSISVQDGAIRNYNAVRSVLARANVIPGLAEVLVGSLPPSLAELVNSPDTNFEWVQVDVAQQGSQSTIHSLVIKSGHFQIQAQGTIDLEGRLDLKAQLVLLEEFSTYLVGRIAELAYLQNPQGYIVIPFVVRGEWPGVSSQPDLAYLAEHLIVEQGAQLLERGLEALSQWEKNPA